MKRDISLVVEILKAAERSSATQCDGSRLNICCHPKENIVAHLLLMRDHNLIRWIDRPALVFRVTWQGYDYLEHSGRK